ncbi:MAG: S9 family peptidase [Cytophagales bacterium]|nr:MAG: S9 family peptidase [Cytophagales bacterium]
MKLLYSALLLSGLAGCLPTTAQPTPATTTAKRPIGPADVLRLQSIADPQVSPDGGWVAFVQSSVDVAKDKRNADIWMISWDGQQSVQLTNSPDGEASPRWSPDGRYLSFVSGRSNSSTPATPPSAQLWLMDRRGGEAKKLTDLKGELEDYEWSPTGKQIALVIRDKDYSDSAKTKIRQPYVLDRYQFKTDVKGYLDRRPAHLYVFDVEKKTLDTLTRGIQEESGPTWSPDGKWLAFVSNHTDDPDRNENTDLYLIEARKGATARQLTDWPGRDGAPMWSPDGKQLAYLRSTGSGNFLMYDQPVLALLSVDGTTIPQPRLLSLALDRPVRNARWAADGKSVGVLVDDDRRTHVAEYRVSDGQLTYLTSGDRAFADLETNPKGGWVTLMSEPQLPTEIYALDQAKPRRLTTVQDEFVAPLTMATVTGYTSKSKDGATVSNLLFLPPNTPATKLPTVFFIHGGPVAQDTYGFDLTRQVLAAGGYAVVGVNYRGSNGRGLEFTKAIYSDWGNKEVLDILGAADALVQQGTADPARLGIGGWSYGGILTNYVIASDTRFKAAASGAGSALQLTMYGSDQYIRQFENELGAPWKNVDKYLKLSYPFLKADRIKTPTMFMASEKDFNVPVAGSEQLYQALRTLNIPTQLVIYPGQFHGITTPSYQQDRLVRYQKWFDTYLKVSQSPLQAER